MTDSKQEIPKEIPIEVPPLPDSYEPGRDNSTESEPVHTPEPAPNRSPEPNSINK